MYPYALIIWMFLYSQKIDHKNQRSVSELSLSDRHDNSKIIQSGYLTCNFTKQAST